MPIPGYDSPLEIPDVLGGITPTALTPPNMPGRWSNQATWDVLGDALQNISNSRRANNTGLTQEAIRAHQESTARLRPFVPSNVLQQIYLARLSGHYDPAAGKYAIPGLGLYPRDATSPDPGNRAVSAK